MPFRVGSLFAGVGGVCLGFANAHVPEYPEKSFELTFANEIDPYPAITYRHNFNHPLIVGDIQKILNPNLCETTEETNEYVAMQNQMFAQSIHILTAGFPCQAFSIAGNREGFNDHRGNLFWSIVDFVNIHEERFDEKPRVLFLENVKNLRNHDNGNTYDVIERTLTDLGYTVFSRVLNTMTYTNIPQNRERIFILCFRDEVDANNFHMFDDEYLEHLRLTFTPEERHNQIQNILEDFNPNLVENQKYFYTRNRFPHYFLTEEDYNEIPKDIRRETRINLDESIVNPSTFYQLRRGMYVRENRNNVCPTLTANMGTGGHNCPLVFTNAGIRKITPEEAFKLQGFPINNGYSIRNDDGSYLCSDGRLYKQAGNSVSVSIIQLLAEHILDIL